MVSETVTAEQGPSASGNPYLFQGRRWDSEVNLYYFRNRVMSPVLGRFLQRDPAANPEESAYELGSDNPFSNLDPTGLWEVHRQWMDRAHADAEEDDTILTLANTVGLEAAEWRAWVYIRPYRPIWTVEGPKFKHQLTLTDKICPGEFVHVPNTVLAYWGGELGGFGKWWVGWGADVRTLKNRGFKTIEAQGWTAARFEGFLRGRSRLAALHGIFFWGHGIYRVNGKRNYVGVATDSGHKGERKYQSYYRNWRLALAYKPALGILFACGTWIARPVFSYNPAAIFWGHPGTLWPPPVSRIPDVKDLVPPGAQGTRPG